MRRPALVLLVAALLLPACSAGGTGGPAATSDPQRPFAVYVPAIYQQGTPAPLVILLHGYGADGSTQNRYFGLELEAERRGFLYVHPDGTKNLLGSRFWNATDGCCGFGTSKVDDVAYLTSIIDQVSARYTVDPKRVFLIGHSNGGFMSYRMACDRADRIAAIVSLAGETFLDPAKCAPSQPVSVLQVQGTADTTIRYDGGRFFGQPYPGAKQTVAAWAAYDHCDAASVPGTTAFDLDFSLAGAETTTESFGGCPPGVSVELWTVNGGSHIPAIVPADGGSRPMVAAMLDFLFAHPKA